MSSASDRFPGQSTLERETKRNTQINKFSDMSRNSFNRQLDRLADEDSDTYATRVMEMLSCITNYNALLEPLRRSWRRQYK